jgi:hypothetical protein
MDPRALHGIGRWAIFEAGERHASYELLAKLSALTTFDARSRHAKKRFPMLALTRLFGEMTGRQQVDRIARVVW